MGPLQRWRRPSPQQVEVRITVGTLAVTACIVFEGLPGAGKTTLISQLASLAPHVLVLEEVILPTPNVPDRHFYALNDLAKVARAGSTVQDVLCDRSWASTAAYVLAEERLQQPATSLSDVLWHLYGTQPPAPAAWVFIDSRDALESTYADDGRFGDRRFRELLRNAYYDIFNAVPAPTLYLELPSLAAVQSFLKRHQLLTHWNRSE
jgi:hypothetical protein